MNGRYIEVVMRDGDENIRRGKLIATENGWLRMLEWMNGTFDEVMIPAVRISEVFFPDDRSAPWSGSRSGSTQVCQAV